jgi:hypothetical protein
MHKPTFEEGRNARDAGNYEMASEIFMFLAEQGNMESYNELTEIYFLENETIGTEKAVNFHKKLAYAGDAFGQFMLGLMHDTGQGVDQDDGEAINWYRKSAKQGVVQAQFNLARKIYLKETALGIGDDVQVYKWSYYAASAGHKGAEQLLEKLRNDKNRKIKFDFNNTEHKNFLVELQRIDINQSLKDLKNFAAERIESFKERCDEVTGNFEPDLKQAEIEQGENENYKEETQNGLFTELYDDGEKKLEKHFKDGKEDGLWTEWYPNGKKRLEKHFKDGKEDGLWTEWSEDGKKKYQGTFKDGNEQ